MNESFANVLGLNVVLIGCKAGEAFFEHIDSQRIVASHDYVYPKIIFEVVDEMRVEDVLRHQHVLFVLNFGVLCDHFYSTAACLVGRLHDP